ncbi:MAG: phospho-N-acetylmuramoyl-pentapeptide-transferase [Oscillospiraceae bacterium]|nr:phospho-N-acetylmuramoyl-pentapeptide-transferase [Oscillospiraceae bacterium]
MGTVSAIAGFAAFVVTALSGRFLIPMLRRLKFGQTILDIGPAWHKKKQGTPTMGGIMFAIGIAAAVFAGYFAMVVLFPDTAAEITFVEKVRLFAGLGLAFQFGFVGFLDDYIKVVKKRNLGLSARQKTLMQLVISVAYVLTLYFAGETSTIVDIPFFGQADFGFIYYPLVIIGMYGFVNAVNLTDGVDGLCGSVTFAAALVFIAVMNITGYAGMNIYAVALAGGCLGFLMWNFYPAKVFMGDTGSMFLGGAVISLAFGSGMPMILLFAGIIYIAEALSVVLQVISFKSTGKRIFKMSPIHHHFEMLGWSEIKIVVTFTAITAAFGAVGVLSVIMR